MINLSLSPEQKMLQHAFRTFAQSVVGPVAERIDAAREPELFPFDHCREALRKGAELGYLALVVPEEHGGLGGSCIDLALLCEELGAVDTAIGANLFNLTATMHLLVARFGSDDQRRRLLGPMRERQPRVLSGALSEPNVAGSDLFAPAPGEQIGIRTRAERDGEHCVLRGAKSAFVTNGGIADGYFVLARTNPDLPPAAGMSMFYVPADSPGLSWGKPTELIGWKSGHHAEIVLDGVRVPEANRIGAEGQAGMLLGSVAEMPVGLAACYVGLARAAFEYARDYAKQRVSWGRPIIEHQAVALKLADMYVDTQAARLMVWDAAHACEADPMAAGMLKAPAAKSFAVDVAIRNAQRCVEILGGYGVAREYKAGKFLGDATVGYACDFTRDLLRLGLVPFI